MSYTHEQLVKLPKWAQSEIKVLEANNKSLERKLSQFTGASETNTFLLDGFDKKPIQKNAMIEFSIGKNSLNTVRAYINRDGIIDINSDSRLGETLVIMPRAANSFYLTFIKH